MPNHATIHLVRHAEHVLQGQALVGRTPGVALSAQGREQAALLARTGAGLGLRAVVTSPVSRARDTADAIACASTLAAAAEPGLDEVDFGAWTGMRFDALAADPAWSDWNTARGLARPPGGETMRAVQARAMAAFDRLAALRAPVLAVSHADVIKAVLAGLLGMPLDLMHRLELSPAGRCVVVAGPGWARVEAVNLPP